MSADPFTLEIIREQLIAAAEESFIALGRSSQSPIIYEVLDYACAITDHTGDIIAQANGVPGFLGTLTFAVKAILEKFPASSIVPGDVFMNNDPYRGGGNHLSDVALISPIFFEDVLVAFAVNKAHWTEVGGMAAGSWTTDSTEIYQEGLQFPAIRLYQGGEIIQSLVDLIAANVRTPEATLGDMFAGVASLRRAEKRVIEICQQYGLAAVQESIRSGLDQGEILARNALAGLPKGEFFAEAWMDDDGLTETPVYVCVKVTVSDDNFVADFSGSRPRFPAPSIAPAPGCNPPAAPSSRRLPTPPPRSMMAGSDWSRSSARTARCSPRSVRPRFPPIGKPARMPSICCGRRSSPSCPTVSPPGITSACAAP